MTKQHVPKGVRIGEVVFSIPIIPQEPDVELPIGTIWGIEITRKGKNIHIFIMVYDPATRSYFGFKWFNGWILEVHKDGNVVARAVITQCIASCSDIPPGEGYEVRIHEKAE